MTVIKLKKWTRYTLDVKTAYLQVDEIQRGVYLKPPKEGNWSGLWKLKKIVYGLKDAAKAWYSKVVKVVEGWEEREADWNLIYSFGKKENKLTLSCLPA